MRTLFQSETCLCLGLLLAGILPLDSQARSYSSGGGRSYSSSSSRSSSSSSRSSSSGGSRSSSSSGGTSKSSGSSSSRNSGSGAASSKSFSSGSGKSYSSGSTSSSESRRSYTSGKSYTSSSGNTFSSGNANPTRKQETSSTDSKSSGFSFDAPAARARKEEASRQEFTRFKESSSPKPGAPATGTPPLAPPIASSGSGSGRRSVYVPDPETVWTRPTRGYTVFYPYVSRPVITYNDPFNSFFWWWLLDRALDDRAAWAYHHRYDMDPARYQALVASDQQLERRVSELEAQQVQRNPNYVPPGIDRDHIGGKVFTFTDYVLRGINTKTFDADQAMTARIRTVPNQAGAYDAVLLRLSDEFAFAENFLNVVKDTTGTFEVKDDESGATEIFTRINDLRESYEASVLVVTETTADGKAPPGKTSTLKLEYWDYWRDLEIGADKTAKEFLFVEMNSDTGWFQIWRGREFFS